MTVLVPDLFKAAVTWLLLVIVTTGFLPGTW